MPESLLPWTADRVRALPDDGMRHESVDGALLVTPAPSRRHQRALLALIRRLDPYVREQAVGELVVSPADVELDPWTLVQPDLFVEVPDALLLAIELVSPASAHADRHLKRIRYQRAGIPEYWVVDADARVVERWRPEDERPEVLADQLEWRPAAGVDGLVIELHSLFEDISS
jgi:Uma2 family endonuclease